jgi:dienelactone hydrolase
MKKLLKIFKIVIISIIICEPLIAQEDYKINQIVKEKDTINFITLSSNYDEKKATILFIQGSRSIPIIFLDNGVKKVNLPFDYKKHLSKFNFVIISRKGTPIISEFELINDVINNPSVEYTKNDNLIYRENQVKKVIKYLRNQDWVDKKRFYIVGHSEGYRVAAKVCENNHFVKKLVCMSADPFNRTTEKIVNLQIENLRKENDSINTLKIINNINNFKSIGVVNDYKKDTELYNWASYEKFTAVNSLLKYENPILIVYGSNDYKAFNNYLLPFILNKKKIELKIYSDLDHNFFRKEFDKDGKPLEDTYHWDRVFKDVVDWLLNE